MLFSNMYVVILQWVLYTTQLTWLAYFIFFYFFPVNCKLVHSSYAAICQVCLLDTNCRNLETVERGKKFKSDLAATDLVVLKKGEFTKLPADHLLSNTSRTRFDIAANKVTLMHRELTDKMKDFILTNRARTDTEVPAVYINGPQGVGKSYSLFEVVCSLRADARNRVIYIPDCGGWGSFSDSNSHSISFLLEAILLAFPTDKGIIDEISECTFEVDPVQKLLLVLTSTSIFTYCKHSSCTQHTKLHTNHICALSHLHNF